MQTPWILIGVVFVATAYAVLKCDEDDSLCMSMARADDDNSTQCEGMAKCFSDDDCHGGTCLGIAVGKCNCGGCLSLLPCEDDSSCGGLKGACDTKKKTCDCDAGMSLHLIRLVYKFLSYVGNTLTF
ncbi:unnamed protein product [Anisakis simplex]|uniref:Chondroitin proteoglycan 3 n=1 Tax=Anisakis simplex TaxID=6269 RepID=A0A0M3JDR3_ANISI|nr:unnamed protein product [Anisakis simplex]